MDTYESISECMKNAYKVIFNNENNRPEWAVKKTCSPKELIHCTIPFIGKEFGKHTRVLLYASAENLVDYTSNQYTYLDNDDYAINRHRASFDEWKEEDGIFPSVHIAPVNNGCLAIATCYILEELGIKDKEEQISPTDFLEKIAVANFGKFSIEGKTNKDYASDSDPLSMSDPYIEEDIKILKPDIIIMPKSIYRTKKEFLDRIKGNARIIGIHQINSSVINRIIKRQYGEKQDGKTVPLSSYEIEKRKAVLSKTISYWYEYLGTGKHNGGIRGKTKDNFLYVFDHLDDAIKNSEKN